MRHLLENRRRVLLVDHRYDQLFHHDVARVERLVRPGVLPVNTTKGLEILGLEVSLKVIRARGCRGVVLKTNN